jgi:hypothetical protein
MIWIRHVILWEKYIPKLFELAKGESILRARHRWEDHIQGILKK